VTVFYGDTLLLKFRYLFFDFDGVIKDSVEIKSDVFEHLFSTFGGEVSRKVKNHHKANGGISRFEKLPIYLEWSGQSPSKELVDEYAEKFSSLVKKKVVASEWVKGVVDYLQNNHDRQTFFLVTATPQQEIEEILITLNIWRFFEKVIGTPTKKIDAIRMLLMKYAILPEEAVMIGDSIYDYEAATVNNVPFVLRKTNLNVVFQKTITTPMIDNFL
jgi:phosphoglycolate phosphatase-like HAD superfamily hydrolase